MLLSDRDIKSQIDSGRVVLDPYEPSMIQPSSIDVRLDKFFRLFDNHKYPFIDPGPPSAAVDFETSAAPFFEGEARTYRYDASRAPGVEATQNAVTPTLTCTSETTHKPSPTPNFGVGPAGQYRVTSP